MKSLNWIFLTILVFFSSLVEADELNSVMVTTKDSHKEVNFAQFKPVTLKMTNHHPQFKKDGEVDYQGYLLKDLLKIYNLKPEQNIVFIGTTGEYSVELKAEEIANDVMIATHKKGKRLQANEHGNQIIYGPNSIQQFPQLKERLFWLWWVKNILVDSTYQNDFSDHQEKVIELHSLMNYPDTDGISWRGTLSPQKVLSGKILNTTKAKMIKAKLINDSIIEIPVKNNFSYFLTLREPLKAGGETLYVVEIKNNKVTNHISHIFYIKKIELN